MTTKELLDSWLSKNYSTLQDRAYKICNSEPNDILNELCLELYSLPEEKLLHLINSNELLLYFIGMLRYSAYSKSSRYQLKYRQVDTIDNTDLSELNLPDIQDIDLYYEQMDVVSSIRQELPWYINQIIDLKQKYTYKEIKQKTTISEFSAHKAYHKGIDYIKNKIQDKQNIS